MNIGDLTRMERDLARWADAADGVLFADTIADTGYRAVAYHLTYGRDTRLFRAGWDGPVPYIELTMAGWIFANRISREGLWTRVI